MSIKTIESMVNWVENNIDDNPTLKGMSCHVGYSSFYCSSRFHEEVGMTFKSYLIKRKLSRSIGDLSHTSLRIIDIAAKYGFSSNEAYSRAFAKEFGISPSQYRKTTPNLNLFQKHTFKHSM